MLNLAFVVPKSKKAKNRFANLMDNNPDCVIEQIKENRVFLRSANGRNFFWVNIQNDTDWSVEFWPCASRHTVHQHHQGGILSPILNKSTKHDTDHDNRHPPLQH